MRVLVVGAGYVGLTAAAVLSLKNKVTIVDSDSERIQMIRNGITPICEPGLHELLESGLLNNTILAMNEYPTELIHDIAVICVGTPPESDGTPNLACIESAVSDLITEYDKLFGHYVSIVLRSTVPPGTTRRIVYEPLLRSLPDRHFGVVYSPEFLAQGRAISDIRNPDRVVIGASDDIATKAYLNALLPCIELDDVSILEMSLESAELSKLASNYYLAMKVSFANEIASLAETMPTVNVDDVLDVVKSDHRIHPSHLGAGLGYGGSCLPKDTTNLLSFARSRTVDMRILDSVIRVNEDAHKRLLDVVRSSLPNIQGEKVAILGFAFKSGTDDTRCSPSIPLIKELLAKDCQVWVHDPCARVDGFSEASNERFHFTRDVGSCTIDASAAFLMTDWELYREMGMERIASQMKHPIIIDGRRMFVALDLPQGIEYMALGSFYND